jgi:hypothetical protein
MRIAVARHLRRARHRLALVCVGWNNRRGRVFERAEGRNFGHKKKCAVKRGKVAALRRTKGRRGERAG